MKGYFDTTHRPTVDLKVIGTAGIVEVPAHIDTGHSGALSLATPQALEIGLERVGTVTVQLADGSIKNEYLYGAVVEMNGEQTNAEIFLTDGDSLLGAEMLKGKKLTVDYANRTVIIEKVQKEAA